MIHIHPKVNIPIPKAELFASSLRLLEYITSVENQLPKARETLRKARRTKRAYVQVQEITPRPLTPTVCYRQEELHQGLRAKAKSILQE